ncbi:PREDICTED: cytochrome P450 [Prunus dulcis]|uniref:PREDICTED: cytochrome P450 n=1 Tax=Prunus dulcis TaxID=3755 RepID=A0A5E4E9D6_PRUDU|nr:cytochrome P450 81E8-like [Prunus dulcis]VVA12012.1 PREDICTED: cytochrome P450 [Prunus dulcis]
MGEPFWYSSAMVIIFTFLVKLSISKITQKHKKNLPPSPPSLPIIGHIHLLKQPMHRTLQDLSQNLGKILRCGSRKVLLVSSALAAEECLTKHDIIFANRPRFLARKQFHYNYTTVSLAPYGDLWRNLRRIMTLEIFSSSRLALFSIVRQGEVGLLLDEIMKSCTSRVELKSKFADLSFNVMTMMVVGKRCHGENVADVEEAKNFHNVFKAFVDLSGAGTAADFLPILRWVDISGLEKKMVRLMAKMDKFLQGLVDGRHEILSASNGEHVKKLMIDNLLSMQAKEPELYTDIIIKGIILVLLVAGTDTTSTNLEGAMVLFLNHPEAMEKAIF